MRHGRWMGRSAVAAMVMLFATPPAVRAQVTHELDAYWAEISRTVAEGDFAGYSATYHPDAVVIFGLATQPISEALAGWEQGFVDTKAGRATSSVSFRFSERRNDATTAHETGIFRFAAGTATGAGNPQYVHFEALIVKRDGWKMLMEYQKGPATETEWNALR